MALQIAALRQQAGLSQKELAERLKTSQQQVRRLESPNYEGHSLSTMRRVADILDADVRVILEPRKRPGISKIRTAAKRRAPNARRRC